MIPGVFVPSILAATVLMLLVLSYPWIERSFTKDRAMHNLLQRPRDVPVRTSLGAAFIGFWTVNLMNGANDLFALQLHMSLNALVWAGRIGSIVVPVISYVVTYHLCLVLQRYDRKVLEHGIETGIIRRLPNGAFIEIHQPLGPSDGHGHAVPLAYQGTPVPKRANQVGAAGSAVPGLFRHIDESGDLTDRHVDIRSQTP